MPRGRPKSGRPVRDSKLEVLFLESERDGLRELARLIVPGQELSEAAAVRAAVAAELERRRANRGDEGR